MPYDENAQCRVMGRKDGDGREHLWEDGIWDGIK